MKKTFVLLLACVPWLSAMAQTCKTNILPTTPAADFTDHQDGTVTHGKTGLTWMRCALGQTWSGATCTGSAKTYTWQEALQAAKALNAAGGMAGKADWRVPNRKELKSIAEEKCYDPAISVSIFPNTPSSGFRSASPYAGYSNGAWGVHFGNGDGYYGLESSALFVRLARGGQSFDTFLIFPEQDDAPLNQMIASNVVTLDANLPAGSVISIVGGLYSINGADFTDQPGTVNPNDQVQIQVTSSDQYATPVQATLTVGTSGGTFTVTTLAEPVDPHPDDFQFIDQTDAELNRVTVSAPVTITGISSAPIGIDGGDYALNDGVYTNQAGTIRNNDQVKIRLTSSDQYDTAVSATLSVGDLARTFTVRTRPATPADCQPDALVFAAQGGVEPDQSVTSAALTITGIDGACPISIQGGAYSLNGGAFTTQPGTVRANDTVQIRVTASAQFDTQVTATLSLGDASANFTVRTRAETPTAADWSQVKPAVAVQPATPAAGYGQALNAVGDSLWIGAPRATFNGEKNRGAVYLGQRGSNQRWQIQAKPLSQGRAGDAFGSALAMYGDWSAVGAPKAALGALKESGRVYLYRRQAQTWKPLKQALITPGYQLREQFGAALAFSDTWLAVGAPGPRVSAATGNGDGSVYLFALQDGTWVHRQTLTPPKKAGRFGASLAMDGGRLIVGAPTMPLDPSDNQGSGTLYAYRFNGNKWIKGATFPLPNLNEHLNGQLGTALALQGDTLAVSAPAMSIPDPNALGVSHPQAGRVFLYSWNADTQAWRLGGSFLQEREFSYQDRFGTSLALANQGQWLLIGTPGFDLSKRLPNAGRTYLYQITGAGPSLVQQFEGKGKNQGLGDSAAMLPDAAFVGAHNGKVWFYQPK